MPRANRIFFENAHYHITDRGNDKVSIFADFDDRLHYLSLIDQVKRDFGLLLPAFALMTNHIHLYLVTPKANLAEAMFALNNAYSHYYNKRHGKTGHLFEDRYKYKLIQDDVYSLVLARYIHLNPVKAGMVKAAEEYGWSSAAQYLGLRGGLADPAIVLDPLSANREKALIKYKEFMAEPLEAMTGKNWKIFDKNRNMVIGDREFKAAHSPHESGQ
jgi:REP element-mobilizing transposase RayT